MDEHKEVTHEEVTTAETTPTTDEAGDIRWGRTIASIVVILVVAGLLVFFYRERNKDNETAEVSTTPPPPQVQIQEPEPVTPPVIVPPTSVTPPPPASTSQTPPPPAPPAPDQSADIPVTPNPSVKPEWQTKKYTDLGFQYSILSSWQEKRTGNRIVVYTPGNGNILATIEALASGQSTLDDIRKQLQNSSEVSNLQTITKNGQPLLRYNLTGSTGIGFAAVQGKWVYYIVDFSENSMIAENFKAI